MQISNILLTVLAAGSAVAQDTTSGTTTTTISTSLTATVTLSSVSVHASSSAVHVTSSAVPSVVPSNTTRPITSTYFPAGNSTLFAQGTGVVRVSNTTIKASGKTSSTATSTSAESTADSTATSTGSAASSTSSSAAAPGLQFAQGSLVLGALGAAAMLL